MFHVNLKKYFSQNHGFSNGISALFLAELTSRLIIVDKISREKRNDLRRRLIYSLIFLVILFFECIAYADTSPKDQNETSVESVSLVTLIRNINTYKDEWETECTARWWDTCVSNDKTSKLHFKPGYKYCDHDYEITHWSKIGYKEFRILDVNENYVQYYIRAAGPGDGGKTKVKARIWIRGISEDATLLDREQFKCKAVGGGITCGCLKASAEKGDKEKLEKCLKDSTRCPTHLFEFVQYMGCTYDEGACRRKQLDNCYSGDEPLMYKTSNLCN